MLFLSSRWVRLFTLSICLSCGPGLSGCKSKTKMEVPVKSVRLRLVVDGKPTEAAVPEVSTGVSAATQDAAKAEQISVNGVALADIMPASLRDPAQWQFIELRSEDGRFLNLNDGGKRYGADNLRLIANEGQVEFRAILPDVDEDLPKSVQRAMRANTPQLPNISEILLFTVDYVRPESKTAQAIQFDIIDLKGKAHEISAEMINRSALLNKKTDKEGDPGAGSLGKMREARKNLEKSATLKSILSHVDLSFDGAQPSTILIAGASDTKERVAFSALERIKVRMGQRGEARIEWTTSDGETNKIRAPKQVVFLP